VNLLRTLISGFLSGLLAIILALSDAGVSAQVFVGGTLTQNTTFTKDNNPYIVFQDLTVPKGIQLTIEAGTELRFSSDTRLVVRGDLFARGTIADSIIFIMNMQIPNQSLWNGIVFDSASTVIDSQGNYVSGSLLSYASIYNTNYSLTLSGNAAVLIEHCLIRKSSYGLYVNDATMCLIRHNRIEQTGFGVFIPSGVNARMNTFYNNDIINNLNIGLLINNSAGRIQQNTFTGNRIRNNYIGMYIGNDGENDPGKNVFLGNMITSNSLEGVRIYQDSTIFINNYLQRNGIGLNLKHSSYSEVSGNIITDNLSWAIQLIDSATWNLISQNVLNRNEGGIRIAAHSGGISSNNQFLYNTIYDNGGKAFLIESAPQREIWYNNLLLDTDTNSVVNTTTKLIHAENNWWGTTRESKIDSLIYDFLDDGGLGLVQYKFPLTAVDTIAPIPAPRNVVKRQAGQDVIVSWDPVSVNDLGGYYVYYGGFDGLTFTQQRDAGNVTSMILPSFSVFDSIAVTAYDVQSDGVLDQPEGHESEYVFALLSPYAGPDTTICINESLLLDRATAFNYESITWQSTGDGSFNGTHILKPRYIPGPSDIQNGSVELILNVSGLGFNLTDRMMVYFSQPPWAFAGNDSTIFTDTLYKALTAQAANATSVLWITSGDGVFDDPGLLYSSYTPGSADRSAGFVVLVLQALSDCGAVNDTLYIGLQKSYSINGRILAGDEAASNSILQVMQKNDSEIKQTRSSTLSSDGYFSLKHIAEGTYYLYAVPDKNIFPGFAPTYYYNDLHWKQSHLLLVNENTFDVDIQLYPLDMVLPQGEGLISGNCINSGLPGQACGDITVLLFDSTGTYLLDWSWLNPDGYFSFEHLPFGSYLIVGEKAGFDRIFSGVITLTPSYPVVDNVELIIEPFKISFYIPPVNVHQAHIKVYPNPANGLLYIDNTGGRSFTVKFTSVDGRTRVLRPERLSEDKAMLVTDNLPRGFYFIQVLDEQGKSLMEAIKLVLE
jgi:hypothetical protein